MNCKVIAALIGVLALALLASIAHADTITIVDSNTTTDGTTAIVDAGNGQTFTCASLLK